MKICSTLNVSQALQCYLYAHTLYSLLNAVWYLIIEQFLSHLVLSRACFLLHIYLTTSGLDNTFYVFYFIKIRALSVTFTKIKISNFHAYQLYHFHHPEHYDIFIAYYYCFVFESFRDQSVRDLCCFLQFPW